MKRPLKRLLIIVLVLFGILLVMLKISGTRKALEGEAPNKTVTEEETPEPSVQEKKPGKKPAAQQESEPEAEPETEQETGTEAGPDSGTEPATEKKPEAKPEDGNEPEAQPGDEPEDEPEGGDVDDVPAEDSVTSGSFASSTGTALNLNVGWVLTTVNGHSTLTLTVDLTSYSLQVGSRSGGLRVTVNGEDYGFDTNAINYDGSDLVTNTLATCEIPLSRHSADITVSWAFNGSYSGTPISSVTASGKAK